MPRDFAALAADPYFSALSRGDKLKKLTDILANDPSYQNAGLFARNEMFTKAAQALSLTPGAQPAPASLPGAGQSPLPGGGDVPQFAYQYDPQANMAQPLPSMPAVPPMMGLDINNGIPQAPRLPYNPPAPPTSPHPYIPNIPGVFTPKPQGPVESPYEPTPMKPLDVVPPGVSRPKNMDALHSAIGPKDASTEAQIYEYTQKYLGPNSKSVPALERDRLAKMGFSKRLSAINHALSPIGQVAILRSSVGQKSAQYEADQEAVYGHPWGTSIEGAPQTDFGGDYLKSEEPIKANPPPLSSQAIASARAHLSDPRNRKYVKGHPELAQESAMNAAQMADRDFLSRSMFMGFSGVATALQRNQMAREQAARPDQELLYEKMHEGEVPPSTRQYYGEKQPPAKMPGYAPGSAMARAQAQQELPLAEQAMVADPRMLFQANPALQDWANPEPVALSDIYNNSITDNIKVGLKAAINAGADFTTPDNLAIMMALPAMKPLAETLATHPVWTKLGVSPQIAGKLISGFNTAAEAGKTATSAYFSATAAEAMAQGFDQYQKTGDFNEIVKAGVSGAVAALAGGHAVGIEIPSLRQLIHNYAHSELAYHLYRDYKLGDVPLNIDQIAGVVKGARVETIYDFPEVQIKDENGTPQYKFDNTPKMRQEQDKGRVIMGHRIIFPDQSELHIRYPTEIPLDQASFEASHPGAELRVERGPNGGAHYVKGQWVMSDASTGTTAGIFGTIEVARGAEHNSIPWARQGDRVTLIHEIMHFARARGLISEAEWNSLVERYAPDLRAQEGLLRAERDRLQLSRLDPERMAIIDKQLEDIDTAQEEKIAIQYEKYKPKKFYLGEHDTKPFDIKPTDTAFAKVNHFFRLTMDEILQRKLMPDYDPVFQSLREGQRWRNTEALPDNKGTRSSYNRELPRVRQQISQARGPSLFPDVLNEEQRWRATSAALLAYNRSEIEHGTYDKTHFAKDMVTSFGDKVKGLINPLWEQAVADLAKHEGPSSAGATLPYIEHPDIVAKTGKPEKLTEPHVTKGLADRTAAIFGRLGWGAEKGAKNKPTPLDRILRAAVVGTIEGKTRMKPGTYTGEDWYAAEMAEARDMMGKAFPELNDGTPAADDKWTLFIAASVPLSYRVSVLENVENAIDSYQHYRATGEFSAQYPEAIKRGDVFPTGRFTGTGVEKIHDTLNAMIKQLGEHDAAEFLRTMQKPDAIKKWNKDYPYNVDNYGMYGFGPKGGGYGSNLMGNYKPVTADVWWTRFWNRVMGTQELKKSFTPTGKAKYMTRSQPRNPAERAEMQEAAETITHALGLGENTAAAQAVLWYYEQEIYRAYKVYGKDEVTFAGATEKALRDRGHDVTRTVQQQTPPPRPFRIEASPAERAALSEGTGEAPAGGEDALPVAGTPSAGGDQKAQVGGEGEGRRKEWYGAPNVYVARYEPIEHVSQKLPKDVKVLEMRKSPEDEYTHGLLRLSRPLTAEEMTALDLFETSANPIHPGDYLVNTAYGLLVRYDGAGKISTWSPETQEWHDAPYQWRASPEAIRSFVADTPNNRATSLWATKGRGTEEMFDESKYPPPKALDTSPEGTARRAMDMLAGKTIHQKAQISEEPRLGEENVYKSMRFDASYLRARLPVDIKADVLSRALPSKGERYDALVKLSRKLTPEEMARFALYDTSDQPIHPGDFVIHPNRSVLYRYNGDGSLSYFNTRLKTWRPTIDIQHDDATFRSFLPDTSANREAAGVTHEDTPPIKPKPDLTTDEGKAREAMAALSRTGRSIPQKAQVAEEGETTRYNLYGKTLPDMKASLPADVKVLEHDNHGAKGSLLGHVTLSRPLTAEEMRQAHVLEEPKIKSVHPGQQFLVPYLNAVSRYDGDGKMSLWHLEKGEWEETALNADQLLDHFLLDTPKNRDMLYGRNEHRQLPPLPEPISQTQEVMNALSGKTHTIREKRYDKKAQVGTDEEGERYQLHSTTMSNLRYRLPKDVTVLKKEGSASGLTRGHLWLSRKLTAEEMARSGLLENPQVPVHTGDQFIARVGGTILRYDGPDKGSFWDTMKRQWDDTSATFEQFKDFLVRDTQANRLTLSTKAERAKLPPLQKEYTGTPEEKTKRALEALSGRVIPAQKAQVGAFGEPEENRRWFGGKNVYISRTASPQYVEQNLPRDVEMLESKPGSPDEYHRGLVRLSKPLTPNEMGSLGLYETKAEEIHPGDQLIHPGTHEVLRYDGDGKMSWWHAASSQWMEAEGDWTPQEIRTLVADTPANRNVAFSYGGSLKGYNNVLPPHTELDTSPEAQTRRILNVLGGKTVPQRAQIGSDDGPKVPEGVTAGMQFIDRISKRVYRYGGPDQPTLVYGYSEKRWLSTGNISMDFVTRDTKENRRIFKVPQASAKSGAPEEILGTGANNPYAEKAGSRTYILKSSYTDTLPGELPKDVKIEDVVTGGKRHERDNFITLSRPLTVAEMANSDLFENPQTPLHSGDTVIVRGGTSQFTIGRHIDEAGWEHWNRTKKTWERAKTPDAGVNILSTGFYDTPANRAVLFGLDKDTLPPPERAEGERAAESEAAGHTLPAIGTGPNYPETKPYRYHGTPTKFKLKSVFDMSQAGNIYGPGLYTTDHIDIARGYANPIHVVRTSPGALELAKERTPTVFLVRYIGGGEPNLIDMERTLTDDVFSYFKKTGFVEDSLRHLPGIELYRRFKINAEQHYKSDQTLETDSQQAADQEMHSLAADLKNNGYDGFLHVGHGGRGGPGKQAITSNVKIYFGDPITGIPPVEIEEAPNWRTRKLQIGESYLEDPQRTLLKKGGDFVATNQREKQVGSISEREGVDNERLPAGQGNRQQPVQGSESLPAPSGSGGAVAGGAKQEEPVPVQKEEVAATERPTAPTVKKVGRKTVGTPTDLRQADLEAAAREAGFALPDKSEYSEGWAELRDRAMNKYGVTVNRLNKYPKGKADLTQEEVWVAGARLSEIGRLLDKAKGDQDKIDALLPEQMHLMELLHASGSEAGRALALRRALVPDPADATAVLQRARTIVGAPLSTETATKLNTLSVEARNTKAKLDAEVSAKAEQAAQAPVPTAPAIVNAGKGEVTDAEAQAHRDAITKILSKSFAGIDTDIIPHLTQLAAYRYQQGVRSFSKWYKSLESEFPGVDIETTIPREEAEKLYNAGVSLALAGRKRWVKPSQNAISVGVWEYANGARDLRKFEVAMQAKFPAGVDGVKMEELFHQAAKQYIADYRQLDKIKDQVARTIFDQVWQNKSRYEKALYYGSETLQLSRTLQTTLDLSAPLRQGVWLTAAHPIIASRAFRDMLRAAMSADTNRILQANLEARPHALDGTWDRGGLAITSQTAKNEALREEAYRSKWASQLKGIQWSERGYTTFLNTLRADVFDTLLKYMPNATDAELQAIGNYVNAASGRGGSHSETVNRAADTMAKFLFSPRMLFGRAQLMTGQPLVRGVFAGRRAARAIATSYVQGIIAMGVMYKLAGLFGGQMDWDWRSGTFGRVKWGNYVLDPTGGMASLAGFAGRMWTGQKVTEQGKVQDLEGGFAGSNRADLAVRFVRGKLAPIPGAIWTALDQQKNKQTGKLEPTDYIGDHPTYMGLMARMGVPMGIFDLVQALRKEGIPQAAIPYAVGFFGGSLDYRKPKPPKETPISKKKLREMGIEVP